jgi:hypothetical protein
MTNLVTLEEYKETSGITSSKEDARLSLLITSVSELVKTYCNRTFIDHITEEKIETFTVEHDTTRIYLSEFPVIGVTTVEERDSYQEDYNYRTEDAFQYYVDEETDSIIKTSGGSGFLYWSKGPGAVRVSYCGGFTATPEDLKLAIYDLITYYFKDERKEMRVIAGSTIRNNASASQRNNVTFPDHIKRVLDLYKSF